MNCIYKNALMGGKDVDIRVVDGKIAAIGKFEEDGVNLNGCNVYPGLVDVHSHGCIGFDTMDAEYLDKMSLYMAKNGTTSWLPTTMTMDMEHTKKVVDTDISKVKGANVLGFHAEGPYINVKYKGAQNEKYIKEPSLTEFKELKNIRMITVAPEVSGCMEFIEKCGCTVAIGHTDADYECCCEAIEHGAKCLTHTFNAMPPLHHRNPGPVGAAIDKNAYVQVICDGIHLHKSVVMMLYRTFGTDRMVLISDSVRATGLQDGEYELGGQMTTVKNSVARLSDGTIAGSTSTLFRCVKKAIEFGIPADDAFKMASQTPAELIGADKGRLDVGCDADFVVVDNDFNLVMTVVGGKVIE